MMETRNLSVQGMTCGGCVASVTRVLKAQPGVTAVEVSLDPGQATVTFDPARVDAEKLAQAIEAAGYDVAR
jgi:copper chaperone